METAVAPKMVYCAQLSHATLFGSGTFISCRHSIIYTKQPPTKLKLPNIYTQVQQIRALTSLVASLATPRSSWMSLQVVPRWRLTLGCPHYGRAVDFSLCREQKKKRKELTAAFQNCEKPRSGFRAPDQPFYGGKRRKHLGQRRWNGKIMGFFKQSQWCTCAVAQEGSYTPESNRRETKILDVPVGYRAFAIRKEYHDRYSESW